MGKSGQFITPFMKQSFVSVGLMLNMAQHGLVMGFTSSLLPTLRRQGSEIPIDDASGSWIASTPLIAFFPTTFIAPTLMGTYGRKFACLVCIVPILISWWIVVLAHSVPALIIARTMQGFSSSISCLVAPMAIGEYTSPRNRGAFLTALSVVIAFSTFVSHTIGSYLHWRICALICAFIAFVILIMTIYTPESPSWLIDKGSYEEGSKVFRWIRGEDEDDELKKMIEANKVLKEQIEDLNIPLVKKIKNNVNFFKESMRKPEFYKPVIIMMHLYSAVQFTGASIIASYAEDIYGTIIGPNVDISLVVFSADVQRLISNACAVYAIKKVKRRTMLAVTVGINIFAFFATSAYVYAKEKNRLPFDHPSIGISLVHIHLFSLGIGSLPMPFIISGEIFPIQYKSLANSICYLVISPIAFVLMKVQPFLVISIGLHGTYFLYGCLLLYTLIVAWLMVPETKDKTLLEIEEEFRGRTLTVGETAQPLTSEKSAE